MSSRKLVVTIMILAAVSMASILTPVPKAFAQAHDVAITQISVYNSIIAMGQTLKINVRVENQGTSIETFNVEVYVNDTLAASPQTVVDLALAGQVDLVFSWNTTAFALGEYTLSAVALLPTDEDLGDNTLAYGTVTVIFPGDVNQDHVVNMADIAAAALAFNSSPGLPNWNPYADMNGDGKVELRDIALAAINFLKTY